MKKILLFIPMYNCEKQIVRVLEQIKNLKENFISEVIVINDKSKDNGEEAAIQYLKKNKIKIKVKVLRNTQNYGLGGVHKVAFDYSVKNGFDYVAILHGDDQGRVKDLLPILKDKTFENYDCMLGSRFMKGSKLKGYSKFRTFGNIVYNILFSIGLQKTIKDLGAGLNLYDVRILKNRFYYKFPDNLTFNCYMLEAAKAYGHKVKFFPLTWSEDDQVSNVKMFSQALKTLKLLAKYFFVGEKFLKEEHRDKKIKEYTSEVIYSNRRE